MDFGAGEERVLPTPAPVFRAEGPQYFVYLQLGPGSEARLWIRLPRDHPANNNGMGSLPLVLSHAVTRNNWGPSYLGNFVDSLRIRFHQYSETGGKSLKRLELSPPVELTLSRPATAAFFITETALTGPFVLPSGLHFLPIDPKSAPPSFT